MKKRSVVLFSPGIHGGALDIRRRRPKTQSRTRLNSPQTLTNPAFVTR